MLLCLSQYSSFVILVLLHKYQCLGTVFDCNFYVQILLHKMEGAILGDLSLTSRFASDLDIDLFCNAHNVTMEYVQTKPGTNDLDQGIKNLYTLLRCCSCCFCCYWCSCSGCCC